MEFPDIKKRKRDFFENAEEEERMMLEQTGLKTKRMK